ncbi:MAG TPA: LptF/LptG family permease [Phycisphaerae bacterium]|nr:LptF/LptG family permease [Phycisphaerae bacterium]
MMIKTLDRYIVRTFLQSLLMWFVVLMALRIVVHLFIKMDEFTENMEEFAQYGNPALILIGNIFRYYFFNSFVFFTEMGGVVIVAAAAFSVARMNHSNELTAMLASGVSLHRVVWPIILISMLMGGLLIIDQEFVIPNIRDKLLLQEDEMVKGGKKRFQIRFLTDGEGSVWYSSNYDPQKEKMNNVLVILRDGEYRYLANFSARYATPGKFEDQTGWMADHAKLDRKKATGQPPWRRIQDTEQIFTILDPEKLRQNARATYRKKHGKDVPPKLRIVEQPRSEGYDLHFNMKLRAAKFIPGQVIDGKVVSGELVRPKFEFLAEDDRILATIVADSATWVPGPLQECHWKLEGGRLFHATDLTKDDLELRQSGRWMDFLSSTELTSLLERRTALDPEAVRQRKYIRFAEPLNNLVMLLLGLPFILSRQRNLKASAGLCVLIVGAFWVFIYICRYMGLPDFWAAFLPLLLFGPVSVLMLDSVKT